MRRSADIDALQHVLSAALGSPDPVCSLRRLDRGTGAFVALDAAVVERPTLVGGGSPYHPSSPAPSRHALDELVRRAETLGVPQILVPNVRRSDDTSALRAAGLVPVAAQSECVVRLTGEVDEILRTRIGAERLDGLRRRDREVSLGVTWERIRLSELDGSPWARDAFVTLHRRQAERHDGHANLYNADALDVLAHGPLADRTELLVRRQQDAVVQAGLITTSHNGRGIYSLTQAIDHDDPAARDGLFAASVYRLYLHARRSGLEWVHLGRGDVPRMRRLGADLFVPLDHWLRAPGLASPEEAGAEHPLSEYAAPPVTGVPVPGPARFRQVPRFDTIDLSSNTNPFLGASGEYPHLDTTELAGTYLATIATLPGHEGVDALSADHLLFSSGSVDGVMLLLAALASPGERVCVTPPTFPLYGHFAHLLRLPVVEVPLHGDDLSQLDTDRILAADPRVTILCDPNNPAGTRLDPEQVHDLVVHGRGLVVIDEAYVEFSEKPSYARLIAQHDNLIVLRTLSKAWGLAGARCGIALAQPGIIDALRRVQVPFGFTNASQHAVRDRLTDVRRVLAGIRRIRAERDRMASALTEHPAVARVFPSETNFLFVRLHKHERVMDQLRGAGIVVADTGRVIPDTCRITIGDRRANTALLEALSSAL
ncbi:pyridoxal phosphate-dependent aminotransferase [Streptomyces rapamycinicus]|uniref:histidinol-phosphate transaminase n=2 Tax=Streptomyces rapamycinicus TaxID=1226757 RepID=A0A0A0NUF5_STRRN|nr:aminotransferase class I/II-fold pyridoxal phosphate-dependent enzyme [Streptomyces rapamycinicus]AGP60999.1 aminotransferase class I/II [Streptomyces rapamycinicus NRRL 5491]MBB4787826.1 histidinol-phosphate aminotransferase [Streptomyces rapamycinicus]RLV72165.1 aminotransferase class I/II [Streptomyces rapamycinicus NRRL 5491]UTP36524.1 aminotransferase class I/II-fold pyridoxal phosphate-dependent enzyme [Streptomyces rapamycinicus NRRL 5491]